MKESDTTPSKITPLVPQPAPAHNSIANGCVMEEASNSKVEIPGNHLEYFFIYRIKLLKSIF